MVVRGAGGRSEKVRSESGRLKMIKLSSLRAQRGNPLFTERLCMAWDCHAALAMTIVFVLKKITYFFQPVVGVFTAPLCTH